MLWSALAVLLQAPLPVPQREPDPPRTARDAQARFERTRRMLLPRERDAGSDPCQTRIGRFCYWYDSTEAQSVPEPAGIGRARDDLVGRLEQLARTNPADGWVAGQLVSYQVEAGRFADAFRSARACRAKRWWCSALAGYALHADQRYADSDSAFAQALAEMPAEQRCDWYDLRRIVPGSLAEEFESASCEERARLANALWELSVPLLSTVGNDLRTEHFSRLTLALIRARAASPHGMAWGSDTRELLLRYGPTAWYTRREPRPGALYDDGSVVGHDREPSYAFFPSIHSVRGVPWIAADAWRLREPLAESRYAPRHVRRIVALPHQLARFPRGDSLLLAVAITVDDTSLAADSLDVTLAALDRQHRRALASGGRTLTLTVPNDSAIVGIEAVGARTHVAARARYTMAPLVCQPGLCVSDLLLTRSAEPSASLDAALRLAVTGAAVRASRPLGVAWEIHAAASREPVRMTLAMEPLDVSIARRFAATLGLAQLPAPVRLQWMAPTDSTRIESAVLRLPPGARGRHRLTLRVERGAQSTVTSRDVTVVP